MQVIAVALKKLSMGLNINIDDFRLEMLCEDLLDSYPYDSIEDVLETLKNARQGHYSFGHHPRSSITMPLIRDWMAQHLERKAEIREKELAKLKKPEQNEKYAAIDYQKFKERLQKEKEQKRNLEHRNTEFNNFKHNYLQNRKEEE